jgi:hypothetical protein
VVVRVGETVTDSRSVTLRMPAYGKRLFRVQNAYGIGFRKRYLHPECIRLTESFFIAMANRDAVIAARKKKSRTNSATIDEATESPIACPAVTPIGSVAPIADMTEASSQSSRP